MSRTMPYVYVRAIRVCMYLQVQLFVNVEAPPRMAEKRGYARLTYPSRRSETDRLTDSSELHVTRAVTAGAPKRAEHGENARTRNTSHTQRDRVFMRKCWSLYPLRAVKTRFWSNFQKANTFCLRISRRIIERI